MCAPASTAAATAAPVGHSTSAASDARLMAGRGTTCATARRPPAGPGPRTRRSAPAPRSCAWRPWRSRCPDPPAPDRRAGRPPTAKDDALPQLVAHFVHDVVVVGLLVHALGPAAHVHQDDRSHAARDDLGEPRLVAQAADVVDDGGPGGERGVGHRRLVGVHGDGHGDAAGQRLDHGHDAPQLFAFGHRGRAGPRGLPADVDQIRAGLHHSEGRVHRAVHARHGAAV